MQAWNIFTNLSPSPARPEKPGQTCNSAPCQKFHFKSSTVLAKRRKNIFEIKSKCTMVNWQKSTKFHLQHEKNVQQN